MGCVEVTAPGVVIRNSKISCGESYAILSGDGDYRGHAAASWRTPRSTARTRVERRSGKPMSPRPGNIHGCEGMVLDINQNITVEDSYIHDTVNDWVVSYRRHPVAASRLVAGQRRDTGRPQRDDPPQHIYGDRAPTGRSATSAIISDSGSDMNVLIEKTCLPAGRTRSTASRWHGRQLPRRLTTASAVRSVRRWATTAPRPNARTKPSRATSTTRQGTTELR